MRKEKDKKRDIFYITHRIELLIWLVIILFFVAISSLGYISKEKNDDNDYQVFLPDVDGLIIGSPVRMMGIEVGHVVKIKPVKNEVYVKFVLTNNDVYIPQGTAVTVEFSGLAGSKSLELYLPDKNTYVDKTTPLFMVESPKRLRDALVLLDNMYKKLTSIIYTSSSFGKKLNEANIKIETSSGANTDFNKFLKYSDKFLDEYDKKAKDIKNNIEGVLKNGKNVR